MNRQAAIKGALQLVQRTPILYCATLTSHLHPDIRAMMNLRSKYSFPSLVKYFDKNSFDTYAPTNTFSGKLLQIRRNPRACLYYYDVTTRESVMVAGMMKVIEDPEVKMKFWQPEWEKYFPGNIEGEEYSLVKFAAEHFKFYDGISKAYEDSDLTNL